MLGFAMQAFLTVMALNLKRMVKLLFGIGQDPVEVAIQG
jgi:hypothetical protein